jgi:methyltransferase (TIGR00027 family)
MDARSSRPSLTATLVALARGVASHPPLGDRPIVDPLRAPLVRSHAAQLALRAASLGLVDHVALRSMAIDDAVRAAVGAGALQLVLLGAGLDARAYRMSELALVTVFEVDHPASQAHKRQRVADLAHLARQVIHVAVDFSREIIGDRLASAGHDASAPTMWVCEGVTMYLDREDVRALVRAVADRSAPGSVLAATYRSAAERPFPPALVGLAGAALRVVGERLHPPIQPAAMRELLAELGLVVESDESSQAWAPRYGLGTAGPILFRSERLVIAIRAPAGT